MILDLLNNKHASFAVGTLKPHTTHHLRQHYSTVSCTIIAVHKAGKSKVVESRPPLNTGTGAVLEGAYTFSVKCTVPLLRTRIAGRRWGCCLPLLQQQVRLLSFTSRADTFCTFGDLARAACDLTGYRAIGQVANRDV